MGWLRRSRELARDTDPLVSWGERIGKWLWNFSVWVVGPSALTGLAVAGLGWAAYGLFYGVLAGVIAFAVIQLSLTLRLFRKSAVAAETQGGGLQSTTEANEESRRTGIPEHMVSERHIRYHDSPIRLVDLLEVAGENGVLRDFTFEHCILEGPGIINLEGPFPKRESRTSGSGVTASLSMLPTHCRVEGSLDTTLYRVTDGAKIPVGVIHLSGYKFESVTFKGLGFVGTPEHLEWLRRYLIFSEGPADEWFYR